MSVRKGKRLVSFLGLGPTGRPEPYYTPTRYRLDGKEAAETPLLETALCELLEVDSLVVLGTKEVKARWVDSGLLERYLPEGQVYLFREITTPHGTTELWGLFSSIIDALTREPIHEAGETVGPETVIFDVTHGFRAQPLFGMAALNHVLGEWSRQAPDDEQPDRDDEEPANTSTFRVLYGAFEDRANHGGVAPVWDLTAFVLASRWNAALDALMRFGRADDFEVLAQVDYQAELKRLREQGKSGAELHQEASVACVLSKRAREFADDLALNRLRDLLRGKRGHGSAQRLADFLASSQARSLIERLPPIRSAMDQLADWIKPLSSKSVLEQDGLESSVALADIYDRLQRFAELAALLRETVIGKTAIEMGADRVEPGLGGCRDARSQPERFLGRLANEVASKRQAPNGWAAHQIQLAKLYSQLSQARNDIEHCGINGGPQSAKELRKDLDSLRAEVRGYICEGFSRGFINLSNHPLEQWSSDQIEAARALGLGDPIDLPQGMPLVPPDAESDEVQEIAATLAEQALALNAAGAFVAGEFTLTAALVSALQARDVRCFSATTEREVTQTEREDGSAERQSVFRFVKWREYPPLS